MKEEPVNQLPFAAEACPAESSCGDQLPSVQISGDPATRTSVLQTASKNLLTSCVHCGFCLEVCPTYQLTGDENNSPRGRLRLWREEAEGRLAADPLTVAYTQECVGCLACEPACPANVPYGEILEQIRHKHVDAHRSRPSWKLRFAAAVAERPWLFSFLSLPVRGWRRLGWLPHRLLFQGRPPVVESTARYAARMMQKHQPTGPRVALLTGCLMEAVFREINFATIRVLIENNVRVIVPEGQTCCGAMHEHLGLPAVDGLRNTNRQAFSADAVDAIVCNSSGCGLALSKTLARKTLASKTLASNLPTSDRHRQIPVLDVLTFLGQRDVVNRIRPQNSLARVYVDLPCHLIHGQRTPGIPENVLQAMGLPWQLAPQATECCGSGGTYHLQQPQNARQILTGKAAFLNEAQGDPVILATSNHVCMMQWNSALADGIIQRPFSVKHVIQLLDPGDQLVVRRPADYPGNRC